MWRAKRDTLLRNADFLRYTGAVAISNLGSQSSGIAFPLLALVLGASNGQVGLLLTCSLIARLACRLPAGQLADRFDRRWLMLWADLVRMVALGTIPLLSLVAEPSFGFILLVGVVEGVAGAVFAPAASAAVRDVVTNDDDIAGAISKIQSSISLLLLIGPALGGWLFSINHSLPFAVDAASYALSAALLFRLRTPAPVRTAAADSRFTAGWRWLGSQTELRLIVLFGAVLNLASGAAYIALVLSLKERGASSTAVGLVLAGGGIGSLAGALLAPRLIRLFSPRGLLLTVGAGWTFGLASFAVAPPALAIVAVYGVLLAISPSAGVLMVKLTLTAVPRGLLGRVRSAIDLTTGGPAVLGPVLAGVAIERAGLHSTWLLLAALAALPTVVAAIRPVRATGARLRARSVVGTGATSMKPVMVEAEQ